MLWNFFDHFYKDFTFLVDAINRAQLTAALQHTLNTAPPTNEMTMVWKKAMPSASQFYSIKVSKSLFR